MKKTVKKGLGVFAAVAAFCCLGIPCCAEIIPPSGPGQIGRTAVVLCDTLTLRRESNADSEEVRTLHFGDRMTVMKEQNGFAECIFTDDVDGAPEGFVNSDFIAIDPAWYRTEDTTPVYAWNDTNASKVAELGKDTTLPILKEDGDWVVVSLRGASGWIHKTDADRAGTSQQSTVSAEPAKQSTQPATQSAQPATQNTQPANTAVQSQAAPEQPASFKVYGRDGSTADIYPVEGGMYSDTNGRKYSFTEGDLYYCIETQVYYSADPNRWILADSVTYGDQENDDGLPPAPGDVDWEEVQDLGTPGETAENQAENQDNGAE